MKLQIQPGRYVVAVSGGVDSVVLLDMLAAQPELELVVAHYDHGIRSDSTEDRKLVQELAQRYGLPFEFEEGKLGEHASEETARTARYAFLRAVHDRHQSDAIITAHHMDDLLETAILNLVRGTGRKGLSSLRSQDELLRPLLAVPKRQLKRYAHTRGLTWREDSTNTDDRYLRNYIRMHVLPRLTPLERQHLLARIRQMHRLNDQLDTELDDYLQMYPTPDALNRRLLLSPPHAVGLEVVATWLRTQGVRSFDKIALNRILIAAKTYQYGRYIDIDREHFLVVERHNLALKHRDR
jgi:tRNA(Ile)-lysidine synthetase-like protein